MIQHRFAPALAALAAAALLAACGGGGGDSDAPATPPSSRFGASSNYAGICTLEGQKQFARAYVDEVYLWYNEVPEVDPTKYNNIPDYFNALLVTTPDANGLPKDRYSAVLPTFLAESLKDQLYTPPRKAATESLLANHTDAVPVVKVVTSPGGRRSGYILFNDHETGAQDDLIAAFRQMRDAGVQDLVLDLRYNSGGFLYIALAVSSMVAGPSSEGRIFEQLRYSDKRSAETAVSTLTYSSKVQFAETQNARGTALPQLGLPRLYVLTSGQTCSSSESIINSLRGIDIDVVLVGDTTCGKPYGFRRKDNCGYAYFPVEFQGFNAKGFGNYTGGFQANCKVADNPATQAGSAADPLLAAALVHMDTGACPAGTAGSSTLRSGDLAVSARPPARPAWLGRLLAPEQK
jgi:hypothetical protein